MFSLGTNTSPLESNHKLIIGVDFGTTYTGVSYVPSSKSSLSDINVITTWPGPSKAIENPWKTPSRIAYASDNDDLGADTVGYRVKPGMKAYSWFKLRLDQGAHVQYDEPELSAHEGPGMLRLPRGKSARDVCADYLREIYRDILAHLNKKLGEHVVNMSRMEFWFTVPAIWSDRAREDTMVAAKEAGFGALPDDEINLITEPEAAAVAALTGMSEGTGNQLKAAEGVLVCDCGGGTVDITTYKIKAVSPRLEFEELLVGDGGKCGSTYIDQEFHTWMSSKFGAAFDTLPFEKRGPGSKFMKQFEAHKVEFGYGGQLEFELALMLPHTTDTEYYDAQETTVKLSVSDMEALFDPIVSKVISLLTQQLQLARVQTGQHIDKIILCGGFGDSQFLNDAVKKWARTQGNVQVVCPEHPQATIAMGAALRGLSGIRPSVKKCRRHYGFQLDLPYDPNFDEEKHMYRSKFDRSKRARGTMLWKIEMGSSITEDTFISQRVQKPWYKGETREFTLGLYSSSAEKPPRREEHPRVQKVGTVKADLTNVPLSRFRKRWSFTKDCRIYQLEYDLQIMLGRKDGVLFVRTKCNEDIVGTAQIEYGR